MSAVYLSCKQAAESLGLSSSTIKRLCDEGVLAAVRTPGGHRRISLKSVQNWQTQAGRELTREPAAKRAATLGLDHVQCCHWLLADRQLDLVGAVQKLRRRMCMAEICDEVLGPALVRLGWMEQTHQIARYQVLRASQRLRVVLCRLSAEMDAPLVDLRAVGASAPGDDADLASLFAEVTLRELGWNAESLGTGLTSAELAVVANLSDAVMVWVCYTHPSDGNKLLQDNRQLFSQLHNRSQLALGGGGLAVDLRRQLSFDFFGDSMVHLRHFAQGLMDRQAAA